jgi:hypothetical protein
MEIDELSTCNEKWSCIDVEGEAHLLVVLGRKLEVGESVV